MITQEAIKELLDGLETARKIAADEVANLTKEKLAWRVGSDGWEQLTLEAAGARRVLKQIEKQIEILEKNDSRRSQLPIFIIPRATQFCQKLSIINQFIADYTVHDDENYDHRLSEIAYNEHGNDELIAKFKFIPYAENPKEHKGEL